MDHSHESCCLCIFRLLLKLKQQLIFTFIIHLCRGINVWHWDHTLSVSSRWLAELHHVFNLSLLVSAVWWAAEQRRIKITYKKSSSSSCICMCKENDVPKCWNFVCIQLYSTSRSGTRPLTFLQPAESKSVPWFLHWAIIKKLRKQ